MINPFKEINWNPGPTDRRKFARSLVVGFPIVAVLLLLVGTLKSGVWHFKTPLLVGGIGAGLGLALLALPGLAKPFYLVWYFLACCIGLVVSNVLLALVFYVFVTGIALAKRVAGKSSFRKTVDKRAASYWLEAPANGDPKQYYRQS